jgi:hypothetical protein
MYFSPLICTTPFVHIKSRIRLFSCVLIYIHFTGQVAAKLRPTLDQVLCMSSRNRIITVNASVLNKTLAMANSTRAPKQWCLTKHETVNSFENWRQNLIYSLSLDKNVAPFLVAGFKWQKKTKTTP